MAKRRRLRASGSPWDGWTRRVDGTGRRRRRGGGAMLAGLADIAGASGVGFEAGQTALVHAALPAVEVGARRFEDVGGSGGGASSAGNFAATASAVSGGGLMSGGQLLAAR